MGDIRSFPELPERIQRLEDLAYNLWWSWNRNARDLWASIDHRAWQQCEENPVRLLATLPTDILASAANDPVFLDLYDAVIDAFDAYLAEPGSWYPAHFPKPAGLVAYLSAEYGLHASLPIYAGGLGILAGDHLKECSDLGVPVVSVGLRYSRGYVTQRVREDGWPDDIDRALDHTFDPVVQVRDLDGSPLLVDVPLLDPPVKAAVWKVQVGRVPLYLLDTDVESNALEDRDIVRSLYASNLEQRLRQEIVLGMGGIRVLGALGKRPTALHINEGHPCFAIVERLSSAVRAGSSFDDAFQESRDTTVFTTHTPLAAGTDVFPFPLIEKYFRNHPTLGLSPDDVLRLGVNPRDPDAGFNTTVFSLRASGYRNAVSKRHGEIARRLWAFLWPDHPVDDVPIDSITNGVHLPTWINGTMARLYDRSLGSEWLDEQDRERIWELINQVPDADIWKAHQDLKVELIDEIVDRAREGWQRDHRPAENVVASGTLLHRDVLSVGFARRFTSYKRPDLLFTELERLVAMVTNPARPIQIIFAGKAHPADLDGKRLIQQVVRLARDPAIAGRIGFIENYDQEVAKRLVAGVDVWLNTPLPPLEASGTSGMKAALNGVPQLSVLDGWWIEGFDGTNGWAFGKNAPEAAADRRVPDAHELYELLEKKVVPLYYERTDDGVPHQFARVMKAAIARAAPRFGTRRMIKEYVTRCYVPALSWELDQTPKTSRSPVECGAVTS